MTRRRTLLAAAGAAAAASALAACNLAPPYSKPALTIPPAYAHLDGWKAARPADDLSRGAWWDRFDDPILSDLEARAQTQNPSLQAALARYDEARGYTDEARASLFPFVGLQGSISTNRQSDNRPLRGASQPSYYGTEQANGIIGWEPDFWGRVRNEVASRKALAQASAADAATACLSLQAELADDYAQLRGVDAIAQLLRDTVAAYQKAYDLTETLYQGKVGTVADVSRAQTQLSMAKAQLSDTAASRALLQHAIAVLAGENASTFAIAPNPKSLVQPAIPVGLPSILLERRPDIASAERAVFSANAEIGVARAAFFPTITLGATGGFQGTSGNMFNLADTFWSLGPSVSLPIFDGGLLSARKREAVARFHETSATYRGVVLNAFREVEDARAQLVWFAKETTDVDTAVRSSGVALDAAMALYRDGAADYLDVVTAQTALLQAQENALQLKTRSLQADVALVRALGGGWSAGDLAAADPTHSLAPAASTPSAKTSIEGA